MDYLDNPPTSRKGGQNSTPIQPLWGVSFESRLTVERTFVHLLDQGGMRRAWLRGRDNLQKRYSCHVAAYNLGMVLRLRFGAGTPRQAMEVFLFVIAESQVEGSAIRPSLVVMLIAVDTKWGNWVA